MATRIQNRRDTAANWTTNNPTLADGEIGFETDTGLFKIGANNTAWTSLAYAQVAGPTGPEGAVGPVGAVGEQGAPGLNGANGENGINGLSAYEIWLSFGNSGTEQDFIDSLAGEDGLAGVDGEDGLAGVDGLGYKVNAQPSQGSWIFDGPNSYEVGSRIRISDNSFNYVEGIISYIDNINNLVFDITIYDSNGTLNGYNPVYIVGEKGQQGNSGQDGSPENIQQLVFSYAASSPNNNSGNWTNSTIYSLGTGSGGPPDIYSQSFTIQKNSATSVIEINFDVTFDIALDQYLGWAAS
jgi:hypothetical protein